MIYRRLRGLLFTSAAALLIAIVPINSARAQWAVFDATNYVQNVLTATRELQQVNNEIQMLKNQATSLVNQAHNLASLPYSALLPLRQSIIETQQLLGQAQHIAYSLSSIDQAFSQFYPQSYSGASAARLFLDAEACWENARASFQDSMRVQARVVSNLDTTRTQIDALIAASQDSAGALQAAQSGNQLAALHTKQLADLTALMASIARAQSLDAARQLETQSQGQAQMQNFLDYGAGYQPGSARMFQ